MLTKFKIAHKIYFLGIAQLILMLIMGLVSITQMNKIGIELIDIAEKDIPLTNKLTKIAEHQLEQAILFERSLLKASLQESNTSNAQQEFDLLTEELVHMNEKITKEFKDSLYFIDSAIDQLHSEKAKKTYQKLSIELKNTNKEFQILSEEIVRVLLQTKSQKISEIHEEIKKVDHHEDNVKTSIINLLDNVQAFTLEAAAQAEHDEKTGVKIITGIFIFAMGIGIILPKIISYAITKPIKNLTDRLIEVNDGDGDLTLTIDASGTDETADVARAFNAFLTTLKHTITDTNKQAAELGESSDLALKIIKTTLVDIETQQMETTMVSTAVNEMSSSTIDVASSTISASKITEMVRKKVLEGKAGAIETQEIIQRLAGEIETAANVIQSLVSETNNIGSVLESIQGIAEQTNLLALNAAIEAARAGESGRGFAVVADEVRTLAQRTQTSTIDIQSLVERLQTEANNAVNSMKKGTDSAEKCIVKSDKTSAIFEHATEAVNEISELNTHIATAANQQSIAVEEVNKNLVNITDIATKTTEGTRNISNANNNISKKLMELYSNLNRFKV
jgi:methyl-accepting chemotaxis protein